MFEKNIEVTRFYSSMNPLLGVVLFLLSMVSLDLDSVLLKIGISCLFFGGVFISGKHSKILLFAISIIFLGFLDLYFLGTCVLLSALLLFFGEKNLHRIKKNPNMDWDEDHYPEWLKAKKENHSLVKRNYSGGNNNYSSSSDNKSFSHVREGIDDLTLSAETGGENLNDRYKREHYFHKMYGDNDHDHDRYDDDCFDPRYDDYRDFDPRFDPHYGHHAHDHKEYQPNSYNDNDNYNDNYDSYDSYDSYND